MNRLAGMISKFGEYVIFVGHSIRFMLPKNLNLRLLLQQMEFIGVKSFWIIVMAAIMIGGVFGLQFGNIFKLFSAEALVGAAASFALSKELAPVVGAFLVTGRAGSAITAEIATMRVNEQIDAMQVMAVNPISYLVSPRILAAMLMLPLLSAIFLLVGVFSSYLVSASIYNVDPGIFIDKILWITKPSYVLQGLEKAVIFGFIFSSISCFKGFHVKGGAKDVGSATTQAVVSSLVAILISDFFISYLQVR